ncbi:MAG: S9 family peptidase [Planctomycetes bacterium]|nr:S9 family peptidase [Planctomycetota bacterium]
MTSFVQPVPAALVRAAEFVAILVLTVFSACGSGPGTGSTFQPGRAPETRSVDVVDDYHGTKVADPFRWLEDQDGEEVLAWVDRQNAHTESRLAAVPSREALRARLTELWDFPRWSAPAPCGERWVWSHNDGLQNQAVLRIGDSPQADGELLFDPNAQSNDGTVALAGVSYSKDGRRVALGLTDAGSDWVEWRVMDVASRNVHEDRVRWSKFSSASWTLDGEGFFYQRYPSPEAGAVHEAITAKPSLCYHRVGTPQADDRVVYERPDHPDWGFHAEVTHDGRFAIVSISEGTDRRNRVAFIDLAGADFAVVPLLMDFDAQWDFVGMLGDEALFVTDRDAPFGRLVGVDLRDPSSRREIVGEKGDKLLAARLVGGELVVLYLRDAHDVLVRHSTAGAPLGEIVLPGPGSIGPLTGDPEDRITHFTFESFARPASVYAFDFDRQELRLVREPPLRFDPEDFVVTQIGFHSGDGTPLQMFMLRRRGPVRLDGSNPTWLYGYGGFDIALRPGFSPERLAFVETGGLFVQVTLRGGGERGLAWHEAGMREKKQNVFDDFFAAAEFMRRNGYSDRNHLAISGRSNGGLLVGACLVQRPWLFGAAIPEVGVLDMLRYHQFTIGRAWAPEYGRSDDPQMFPVLRAYSPLHNVRETVYPPTLIMTGDHDDRVLPGHSYKFAATLQAAQRGPADVLLRITRRAGHGAGKATSAQIAEATDRLAFLAMTIGAQRR